MYFHDEFNTYPISDQSFMKEELLNTPSLEDIKNILYDGLHEFFNEFEVEVVSCPSLTHPPYNLVADGLSGNTAIVLVNKRETLIPDPQRKLNCNVPCKLFGDYDKFFLIGGGYAAKPYSPYNGYLSTNIHVEKYPLYFDVINQSCIAYEEATTGQKLLQSIDCIPHMACSMLGNFFVSEGKPGKVIKVRAKGRKSNFDILTLMQCCLSSVCRYGYKIEIALGGVLRINGGRVIHFVTPENYPERFYEPRDFFNWLKIHEVSCKNLITVGAFFNDLNFFDIGQYGNNGPILLCSRYKFYNTVNSEAIGQFNHDITPNETEYIGYFNVAKHIYTYDDGPNVVNMFEDW